LVHRTSFISPSLLEIKYFQIKYTHTHNSGAKQLFKRGRKKETVKLSLRFGGVVQVVEHLPHKHEALSWGPLKKYIHK
jgi:hypothetical protein